MTTTPLPPRWPGRPCPTGAAAHDDPGRAARVVPARAYRRAQAWLRGPRRRAPAAAVARSARRAAGRPSSAAAAPMRLSEPGDPARARGRPRRVEGRGRGPRWLLRFDAPMDGVPRLPASAAPAELRDGSHGGGRPLDPGPAPSWSRASAVTRPRARTTDLPWHAARAIGARAYALGSDLVFGAGHYAPSTSAWRRLLAHETPALLQHARGSVTAFVRRAARADDRPPRRELHRSAVDESAPRARSCPIDCCAHDLGTLHTMPCSSTRTAARSFPKAAYVRPASARNCTSSRRPASPGPATCLPLRCVPDDPDHHDDAPRDRPHRDELRRQRRPRHPAVWCASRPLPGRPRRACDPRRVRRCRRAGGDDRIDLRPPLPRPGQPGHDEPELEGRDLRRLRQRTPKPTGSSAARPTVSRSTTTRRPRPSNRCNRSRRAVAGGRPRTSPRPWRPIRRPAATTSVRRRCSSASTRHRPATIRCPAATRASPTTGASARHDPDRPRTLAPRGERCDRGPGARAPARRGRGERRRAPRRAPLCLRVERGARRARVDPPSMPHPARHSTCTCSRCCRTASIGRPTRWPSPGRPHGATSGPFGFIVERRSRRRRPGAGPPVRAAAPRRRRRDGCRTACASTSTGDRCRYRLAPPVPSLKLRLV